MSRVGGENRRIKAACFKLLSSIINGQDYLRLVRVRFKPITGLFMTLRVPRKLIIPSGLLGFSRTYGRWHLNWTLHGLTANAVARSFS